MAAETAEAASIVVPGIIVNALIIIASSPLKSHFERPSMIIFNAPVNSPPDPSLPLSMRFPFVVVVVVSGESVPSV